MIRHNEYRHNEPTTNGSPAKRNNDQCNFKVFKNGIEVLKKLGIGVGVGIEDLQGIGIEIGIEALVLVLWYWYWYWY